MNHHSKIRHIRILPLAFFILFGCMGGDEDPDRVFSNGKFTDSFFGYSLNIPASWQARVDYPYQNIRLDLLAIAPADSGFSPNLNIIHSPKQSGQDLQARLASELIQLQAQIPGVVIMDQGAGSRSGVTTAEALFTWSSQGIDVKQKLVMFERKNMLVVLTFTDKLSKFDTNVEIQAIDFSLAFF